MASKKTEVSSTEPTQSSDATAAVKKTATAKKPAAKKATTKAAGDKKPAASKATAKKTTTKAAAEKKPAASKAAAKKTTETKKATAKKTTKKTIEAGSGALLDQQAAAEVSAKVKKTGSKAKSKKATASLYISAIGRRKTSVARVYIKRGSGQFLINRHALTDRYAETTNEYHLIIKPLVELDLLQQFDVVVRVNGGGKAGQAGAIQLGLSRALDRFELTDLGLESAEHAEQLAALPSRPWRVALKLKGLLTRDARIKERKKFGLRKARKKEQYSKR